MPYSFVESLVHAPYAPHAHPQDIMTPLSFNKIGTSVIKFAHDCMCVHVLILLVGFYNSLVQSKPYMEDFVLILSPEILRVICVHKHIVLMRIDTCVNVVLCCVNVASMLC